MALSLGCLSPIRERAFSQFAHIVVEYHSQKIRVSLVERRRL